MKRILKRIFHYFLWIGLIIVQSTQSSSSGGIPIYVSCNLGIPALQGCQSLASDPKFDCGIHRLGFAAGSMNKSILVSKAESKYKISVGKIFSTPLFYTSFCFNGYYASNQNNQTLVRLGSKIPLTSNNTAPMKSGFYSQYYNYTLADIIFFAQNIITSGLEFPPLSDGISKNTGKIDYSLYNEALRKAFVEYLTGQFFFSYSASSGNYLGGSLQREIDAQHPGVLNIKNKKEDGLTDLQNYVFDGVAGYGTTTFVANNLDLLVSDSTTNYACSTLRFDLIALGEKPKVSSADNVSSGINKMFEINYGTFNDALVEPLKIKDYFNDINNSETLYIPIHFSDPGMTYNGIGA